MKHESILEILTRRFAAAVAAVTGRPAGETDPAVRASQDPKFGDYQCNVAMSLARPLRAKPREIAERIVAAVDLEGIAAPPEIAGPGFINVRLLDSFVSGYLAEVPPPEGRHEGTEARRHEGEGSGIGDRGSGGVQSSASHGPKARDETETPGRDPSEPEAQAVGASDEATKRRSDKGEHRRPAGAADSRSPIPDPRSLFPDRLGMPPVESPQRVVVDYSSPNIAKQMHVGHLRSTIIGDAIARVLMFEGHDVIRQNHVGDWGPPVARVVRHLLNKLSAYLAWVSVQTAGSHERESEQDPELNALVASMAQTTDASIKNDLRALLDIGHLEEAYRTATADAREDWDRGYTRLLQGNEPGVNRTYRAIRDLSLAATQRLYRRLGVLLSDSDTRGESFYNDRLAAVVDELTRKLPPRNKQAREGTESIGARESAPVERPIGDRSPGTSVNSVPSVAQPSVAQPWAEVREDAGALCIFFYDGKGGPRFRNAEGEELPMIIRKSDGAYLYATTDLAAIKFRLTEIEFGGGRRAAQWIIYVTDARQKLHFEMLFAAARAVGWADDSVRLEHVTFGSVLGNDNKPLKTREGENVKLQDLLDEAEQRALAVFADRDESGRQESDRPDDEPDAAIQNPESKIQNEEIARAVGIAAVKYFDLNRDRNKDYVFDWDRMLAMQGNTAPYMMYAYARIRSIYRKAAERFGSPDVYAAGVAIALEDPAERALAMRLARFRETIDSVAGDLSAHVLCNYLYETAAEFMRFYEACPVLAAPEPLRLSRMRLCDLTARTLKLGLGLLGIDVIERM